MRITVTLARQLGSAGSELGHRLADSLGVRCLDREIVSQAARRLDWDEAELVDREERASSFWERMLRGITASPPEAMYHPPPLPSLSDRELFAAETEVMRAIAAAEDCVIVGRAASQVLADQPGAIHLFLHAPLRFRVPRVMAYYGAATEAEARAMIAQSDETRRRWITQMTGREPGDATAYDLGIDTSSLPLPDIAALLTDYVRRRTG